MFKKTKTQKLDKPVTDLYEISLYVYRYARRWAVSQSKNPADAITYDTCVSIINNKYHPKKLESIRTPSAVKDRYLRYGKENLPQKFNVPTTATTAVITLHRFARNYTNGRGTYTATLVNETAKTLLELGVSLEQTQALEGTIWAADGAEGKHDGLTPQQRNEALKTLERVEQTENE